MNKSTKPLLLAAMMAVAGFAVAQTSDASSSTTRAAVKSEAKANVKALEAGTDGGAGPMGKSGVGDNSPSTTTRAAVKAGTTPMKAGTDGGEGPTASKKALTSAERKVQRAQDSAARKARHAGKANNPPVKDGRSAL